MQMGMQKIKYGLWKFYKSNDPYISYIITSIYKLHYQKRDGQKTYRTKSLTNCNVQTLFESCLNKQFGGKYRNFIIYIQWY